jgi:hypothetical protein
MIAALVCLFLGAVALVLFVAVLALCRMLDDVDRITEKHDE